jgi:hypothetical protein
MKRTFGVSVGAFLVIAVAWCVYLVCYQPTTDQDLDPLGPVNLTFNSQFRN